MKQTSILKAYDVLMLRQNYTIFSRMDLIDNNHQIRFYAQDMSYKLLSATSGIQ